VAGGDDKDIGVVERAVIALLDDGVGPAAGQGFAEEARQRW
jgi:hypothetical protein